MLRRTEEGCARLDPKGIAVAMDAISHQYAHSVRSMFQGRDAKNDDPRISDIMNLVCHRCFVHLPFAWAWMCSDFPLHELASVDWEALTIDYLEVRLQERSYRQMEELSLRMRDEGWLPDIRAALKLQRSALGLSLSKMAVRLGVDRGFVSSLEHGCFPSSMPRCHTLNRVLPAYELHPVRLLQLSYLVSEDRRPL